MFKDSGGRWRTKSLFYEANDYQIEDALFTLGEEDKTVKGKTLISLRKRFVEADDPTGYIIANEYLGGYAHWDAICKSTVRKEVEKWQDELEVKLRCIGLSNTIKSAKSGNFNAAKFLAERGWSKPKAGRPTKDDIARETKIQAALHNELEDDLRRMAVTHGESITLN